ncbi:MAG: calcium-binding protein [Defluviicoccus sp.]
MPQICVGTAAADNLCACADKSIDYVDIIYGLAGDDTLAGGWGADILDGGAGGESIGDTVDYCCINPTTLSVFGPGFQGVMVRLDLGWAIDRYNLTDTVFNFENIIGSCNPNWTDVLIGDGQNNRIWGRQGPDSIGGLNGNDWLWGENGKDTLDGGIGNDTLWGGNGVDLLYGGNGKDELWGENHNDILSGGIGNDSLWGGGGNDVLAGGNGKDELRGEVGDDVFDYNSTSESLPSSRDVIGDFSSPSGSPERIDLFDIDAKPATTVNDAFTFIGTAGFSLPGEVRYDPPSNGVSPTVIQVNTAGTGGAEMEIELTGNIALDGGDFIL